MTEPDHPYRGDMNCWVPLELSDRTVLIQISGFETTICAFMIDPSLDENVAAISSKSAETNVFLFYSSNDGHAYTSGNLLGELDITGIHSPIQELSFSSKHYQLIIENIAEYDLQLNYLIPVQGFWKR